MPILEISQQPGRAPDRYDVEVELSDVLGVGKIRFSREIAFALPAADRERIRWYLEDYLEFDHDPAPAIAKSVETLMERTGADLFAQVFDSSPEGQRCWALASMALPQTRIEIVTDVRTATDLPWELMRDAAAGTVLALSAREFVRGARGAQQMFVAQEEPGVVRSRTRKTICSPPGPLRPGRATGRALSAACRACGRSMAMTAGAAPGGRWSRRCVRR